MITISILLITCVISLLAFKKQELIGTLIFYPPAISQGKQWYRFFTCGFIHADIGHLFFNMYTFLIFGKEVEDCFVQIFGSIGRLYYLLLYVSALPISILPTYFKNKDNSQYQSLGASGAVSAVVFAFIILAPTVPMGMMFIPVYVPAFLFGFVYLLITAALDKRGGGNINHSAHLFGALYGILFLLFIGNILYGVPVLQLFIENIQAYIHSKLG